MRFEDWIECLFCSWGWRFRRLKCFFLGCKISYWSENEYIGGTDCSRCDAGIETSGYETPWELFEENLIERLFPRFWMNHFG